ncbi:MAG: sulfurtransferase TusA family protein [Dehalococcoidia bacterium]|nr:SirA family protein [Dehalococcoidia bacterium]MBF8304419.1 SirA family protein [Dehalococcoidia bacterium]MDO8635097.1 sulfurtransferase TusA family protein [Dehalococcoidia bacterium]
MDTKGNGFLDLRGVACPMNWVRTKMVLEEMEIGQKLEVVLDDGEPIRNVPRSLKDEGHKLLKVTPDGSCFRIVIERG